MQEADDLCNAVGYGGMAISKILPKLRDEVEKVVKTEEEPPKVIEAQEVKTVAAPSNGKSGGIIIDGERGCAFKFAKCCNPLPGDSIIGFITKGYGVSIHKHDCPNVISGKKNEEFFQRWVKAEWDLSEVKQSSAGIYEAVTQIFADNDITVIANITAVLADMRVSILQINSQARSNDRMIINLKISCKNIEHYKSIVSRLKDLNGVENVTRGFS
jgi:GTP pyrophosphokinase